MISRPHGWIVEHRKIVDYLWDIEHPDGRAKARALLRAGFDRSKPEQLVEALLAHVAIASVQQVEAAHGTMIVCEGSLVGPSMVLDRVRSVWLLKFGETRARLVTAYPFDQRKGAERPNDP